MSKKILVTGGAGYIGSHCCKALANSGYEPVTYDNLERGNAWAVKWGPLEQGDIRDKDRLEEVIKQYKPEAVMHFAAYTYVGESTEKPDLYYDNNVRGSHTLLDVMKDTGVQNFIFSSSCSVYGIPVDIPITEDHPKLPVNPYGRTKLQVEQLLKQYDSEYDIRSISLRYFNAAGADPDTEIGECHDPETHLIPLVLDVAAGKRPEITIFGNDYETSDGTCIRDYIHVTDLANAHIFAYGFLEENQKSTAYNLGNGVGFSVREIIDKASEITNYNIPYLIGARRSGDPPVLIASAEKIKSELGWGESLMSMDEIIQSAWSWHNISES